MPRNRRHASRLIAALTIALGAAPCAEPLAATPLDRVALAQLVDEHVSRALAESGIPGAVVAVVADSEIVLLAGYGVADVENGRPVDPERTLYRLGSITKPMIGIATLRLAERGLLDLDTAASSYLGDRSIPDTFDRPVTLRHLLTHRGGFDADLSFSVAGPAGSDPVLGQAAIARRLDRIRRPGGIATYDVIGFGLLGLVLEQVAGQSLPQLLADEVFAPAGMHRSVVGIPTERAAELARCHVSMGPGTARVCPHGVLTELFRGSGSVAAPAADMARLMIELLHGWRSEGTALLSPQAFASFVDFDSYRFHPAAPGLGLGIRERRMAGHRGFGHGGGIHGFNNDLVLFPEHDVGIYLGVNGGAEQIYDARLSRLGALASASAVPRQVAAAEATLRRLPERIVEALLPPPEPSGDLFRASSDPGGVEAASSPAATWEGRYYDARFISDNLMVAMSRLALGTEVVAVDENALLVDGHGPYRRLEPGWFVDETGATVGFRTEGGKRYLAHGGDPYSTSERLPRWQGPLTSLLLFLPAVLIALSAACYLGRRSPAARRRAALTIAFGTLALLVPVVLELEFGTLLAEVEGRWAAALAWRLGLHAGVIALAAGALATARQVPSAHRAVGAHLIAVCLAALYLVFFTLRWGLLGRFFG